MKKLIKKIEKKLVPFRVGSMPGKTLLWIWLRKDLNRIGSKNIGIDAACGPMINYKYIKAKKYIGFDLSEKSIKKGLLKYPEAKGVVCSLENAEEVKKEFGRGDTVVCVQTIGINGMFNCDNLYYVVDKLVSITNAGGSLIFNIGPKCGDVENIQSRLTPKLESEFKIVKAKRYGLLHEEWVTDMDRNTIKYKLIAGLNILVALIMKSIPGLAHGYGRRVQYLYFVCEERL